MSYVSVRIPTVCASLLTTTPPLMADIPSNNGFVSFQPPPVLEEEVLLFKKLSELVLEESILEELLEELLDVELLDKLKVLELLEELELLEDSELLLLVDGDDSDESLEKPKLEELEGILFKAYLMEQLSLNYLLSLQKDFRW